jgi:hypothetical protein
VVKSFGGTNTNLAMMTHGTAKTKRLSARRMDLSAEAEVDCTVQMRHFYYEGWTAFLAGKALRTTASKPDGLIQFSLPPGRHQVQIILSRSQPELLGVCITFISTLIGLICFTPFALLKRRPSHCV